MQAVRSTVGDTRLLWVAHPDAVQQLTWPFTDGGGKLTPESGVVDVRSRVSRLGQGYSISFDGSANTFSLPDSSLHTFGNGTTDQAFSIVSLLNVTDTANNRSVVFKDNSVAREWSLNVETNDFLAMRLYDSANQALVPVRFSTAAITQASWHLYTATYDGTGGGAAAAAGIHLYRDSTNIDGTATENASYVAMGNKATVLGVGTRPVTGAFDRDFQGSMAMVIVSAGVLSAGGLAQLKALVNGYYSLAL